MDSAKLHRLRDHSRCPSSVPGDQQRAVDDHGLRNRRAEEVLPATHCCRESTTSPVGHAEPSANTDLADLCTTGVRDGDDYVIKGQKMQTSLIQYADDI